MFSKLAVKTTLKPFVVVKNNFSTSSRLKNVDDPWEIYKQYSKPDHKTKNLIIAFTIVSTACVVTTIRAWYLEWDDLWHPWKHRPPYVPYAFYWRSYSRKFPWGEFPIMFNKYKNPLRDGYITDDEGNLIRNPTTYP